MRAVCPNNLKRLVAAIIFKNAQRQRCGSKFARQTARFGDIVAALWGILERRDRVVCPLVERNVNPVPVG